MCAREIYDSNPGPNLVALNSQFCDKFEEMPNRSSVPSWLASAPESKNFGEALQQ